jgi:hypothetical protein
MSKGLPKAIIKKYGISKKAWSVFRGSRKRSVGSMVKGRKRSYRRRAGRWIASRRRTAKLPLIPIAGAGIALAMPSKAANGQWWGSPLEKIQQGDPMQVIQTLANNYAGVGLPIGGGYTSGKVLFDPFRLLNVFDLEYAVGAKYAFWGSIGSWACRALGITRKVQPFMKKIPIVRKFTL